MDVALTVANPHAVPGIRSGVTDGHVRLAVSQTRQATDPAQEDLTCAGLPGITGGLA